MKTANQANGNAPTPSDNRISARTKATPKQNSKKRHQRNTVAKAPVKPVKDNNKPSIGNILRWLLVLYIIVKLISSIADNTKFREIVVASAGFFLLICLVVFLCEKIIDPKTFKDLIKEVLRLFKFPGNDRE